MAEFNDIVQQAKDVQLPFGISLFDVIVVLVLFLIINKIMGGKLIEAIKAKLSGQPAAPAGPIPPPVNPSLNPAWKPGVEDVNSVLVAAGVPQTASDAFVKEHWEEIRGTVTKPAAK